MPSLYPSRFDRLKRWLRHLFPADAMERAVQVPELNEVYDLMDDRFKQIGDAFFKNGDIKTGLDLIVSPDKTSVTVTGGQIWEDGLAYDVDVATVAITGAAEEIIGVKIIKTEQTEIDDPTYRDPVGNTDNFGMPGAHRLVYATQVVKDDQTAYKIGTLRFGEVVNKNSPSEFGVLGQQLATRTFDAHGHFTINGFNVSVSDTDPNYVAAFKSTALDDLAATVRLVRGPVQSDSSLQADIVANSLTVTVEGGVAYPLGYPVHRTAAVKTLVPKAKDTSATNNEPHSLTELLTDGAGHKYLMLQESPVSTINVVTAPIRATDVKQRGVGVGAFETVSGQFAPLAAVPIVDIFPDPALSQTPYPRRTTVAADDGWYLVGRDIHWGTNTTPGTSRPVDGATYYVLLNWVKTLSPTQYLLEADRKLTFTDDAQSAQFSQPGDGQINVDYNWFLNRIDLVGLNQFGENAIVLGQSARIPVQPAVPDNILPLAYISLAANSNSATTVQSKFDTKRLTVLEQRRLLGELDRIRYEQAVANLNNSARTASQTLGAGATPSSFLTDTCTNLDKLDLSEANAAAAPAAVNPTGFITAAELRTAYVMDVETDPLKTTCLVANGVASLTNARVLGYSQLFASEGLKLNEFGVVSATPTLTITPSEDFEAVQNTGRNISVMHTLTNTLRTVAAKHVAGLLSTSVMEGLNAKILVPSLVDTIRTRTVTLVGKGFPANEDNLKIRFHDVPVTAFTLVSGAAGTDAGTVKATATGTFELTFTIPAGVLVGVREVNVSNVNVGISTLYKGVTTTALALGLATAPDAVSLSNRAVDFVGMNIQFSVPTPVLGVQFYFKTVDTTQDVVVEVRETSLGIPTKNIVAQAIIPGSALVGKASNDASVATDVVFDRPFVARANQAYAVVPKSASTTTELWVARTGQPEVSPSTAGAAVVPSFGDNVQFGTTFVSPTGVSWQADFARRLKMGIFVANYSAAEQKLYFKPVGRIASDPTTNTNPQLATTTFKATLPVNPEVEGTKTVWEYSTNGTDWTVFNPKELVTTPAKVDGVIVRASLSRKADFSNSSPVIYLGTPALTTVDKPVDPGNSSNYKWVASWINVANVPVQFNRVKVQVDFRGTANSQLSVYVGYIDPANPGTLVWIASPLVLPASGVTNLGTGWFTRKYDPAIIPLAGGATAYKVRVEGLSATGNPNDLPEITNAMFIAYAE